MSINGGLHVRREVRVWYGRVSEMLFVGFGDCQFDPTAQMGSNQLHRFHEILSEAGPLPAAARHGSAYMRTPARVPNFKSFAGTRDHRRSPPHRSPGPFTRRGSGVRVPARSSGGNAARQSPPRYGSRRSSGGGGRCGGTAWPCRGRCWWPGRLLPARWDPCGRRCSPGSCGCG